MQKTSLWENILITIGRAQSASSTDETRFIANHLLNIIEGEKEQVEGEYNAVIDELNREILKLREPVTEC